MSRRQTELHASPLALSTLFRRRACVNYNCTPYQDTLYCTVTVHTVNTIWNTSERMLKLILTQDLNRAAWLKGICLIQSIGADIFLPTCQLKGSGNDWYLKRSLESKRAPGPKLRVNRHGTTLWLRAQLTSSCIFVFLSPGTLSFHLCSQGPYEMSTVHCVSPLTKCLLRVTARETTIQ